MATRKIEGILFDKDGTLIDFNGTWLPAYRESARRLARRCRQPDLEDLLLIEGGWNPTDGNWQAGSLLASGSNREIVDFWSQRCGNITYNEVEEIVFQTFHEHSSREYRTIAKAERRIVELKQQGYQIGMATMDDAVTAHSTVSALNLEEYFDFVCGADSGYGVKPDAGMVIAFCQAVDLKAEQVMMVGDSPHDLNMGRAAGVGLVVGVLSGAHDRAHLEPLADHILNDISELQSIL
ncbi:MAG: phosphoglycolate phosphatase [Parasphingorhabdus sp.]|jgi:phosphoglycolate phosphatase